MNRPLDNEERLEYEEWLNGPLFVREERAVASSATTVGWANTVVAYIKMFKER